MNASQPATPVSALHRFHDLLLGDYSNRDHFLLALLELGRELLRMPCGIVSRIHGQDYEILACSPHSGELYPGAHFTMGRTFSAEALEADGTVTLIAEPGVEGSFAHPAYTSSSLRSFIGTPIRVRGRFFGTLDFCDTSDREVAFSAEELDMVELLARATGQALEQDLLEREREIARERMEQHISLFEGAFNNAAFGMALVSRDARTLRVNTALTRILGYSEEDLVAADFKTITHPDDLEKELVLIRRLIQGEQDSYRLKKRFFHRNGSPIWTLVAVSVARDNDGQPLHFIAQIEDITGQINAENALMVRQRQLENANRQLEKLARTDALTGLANRRELLSRMELELKRSARTGLSLSVVLVDVDHFKAYNDSFGHPEGDRALKVVADSLRDACRDTDLVVRYGGEEFAALLPDTRMEDALMIAERMRASVAAINTLQRDISASIGVATTGEPRYRRHHDTDMEIAAALEAADQALYQAKKTGRNRVKKAVGF